MRRGLDQPSTSTASRTNDTTSLEQPERLSNTRTRKGRYDVSDPTEGAGELRRLSSRRRSSNPLSLSIPQQLPGPQARKSPAYLQGKNPYGQILSSVEHSHRVAGDTASSKVGQASNSGVGVQDQSHASSWDEPQQAQVESDPDPAVIASDPQPPIPPPPPPPPPQIRLPKVVSVQAARSLFETRASQNPSVPVPPASAALVATGVTASDPQLHVHSQPRPTHLLRAVESQPPRKKGLDTAFCSSNPSHELGRNEVAQRIETPELHEPGKPIPNVVVRTATSQHADSPVPHGQAQIEKQVATGRRRSTNIFADNPRNTPAPHSKQLSTIDAAKPTSTHKLSRTESQRSSAATVKRHRTRTSSSSTELDSLGEVKTNEAHKKARRSKSVNFHRRASEKPLISSPQRLRRGYSRSAPSNDRGVHKDECLRRAECRSSQSSASGIGVAQNNIKSNNVHQKAKAIATKGLSHDGSGARHDASRHIASSPIATADIGVQKDYHSVEVPHYIDWRRAYGRRKTQDFGFAGAHIKPRSTFKSQKPLQDPSTWIRQACGHFSYMGKREYAEVASRRPCRNCLRKDAAPIIPQPARSRRHLPVATAPSNPSSSTSNPAESSRAQDARHRPPHPQYGPPNTKCGDTFAQDLGLIIDAILEEHTSTLQDVIRNIKRSQPSLAQATRTSSQNLSQRSLPTSLDTYPRRHNPVRPPCLHHPAHHHHYQPVRHPHFDASSSPPYPYIPPTATEKLNVGPPGQLAPNLNDARAMLCASVQSIAELIELVNSAADDLDVDLAVRPSVEEDRMFDEAPYEKMV